MVLSFLIQSATVYRWTAGNTDPGGVTDAIWTLLAEDVPCRLMHDAGATVDGEAGTVKRPRCYFLPDADVNASDEIVVDGIRYAIENFFGPAEGGTHYQVATVRSALQG